MSGICAVWHKENPARVSGTLGALTEGLSLTPRDRSAQEIADGVGVGATMRFQTQQVCRRGHLLLACDAELLNERDLAAAVGLPAGAQTAELLAALYERFGGDFVEELRGAFSVVLWDKRERRLLAAIDSFGIKRLAYYEDEKVFLVASRVDALARSGVTGFEINPRAIANVLNYSANLAPETVFTAIHRLGPGERLLVSARGTRVEKYWDLRYAAERGSSEAKLARELESVVERSVADHCGPGPASELGAYLSGGTDSSTVLGMMTRAARAPVKSFSIGFQEHSFNELGYAELAAKKFGSAHHTYLVGPQDCFEALPRMVRCFDEPFGNSSAIPTYFCARLGAEHGVKTMLAGDGGDELFGGNERYATDKIYALYSGIPQVLRKGLIEPLAAGLPARIGGVDRARRYIRRANLPGVERMLSFQFLRTHSVSEVFETDFLRALGDYSVLEIPARHYNQAPARDHLNRLLYVDAKITLADNDLPKVTCMSELAGVETRFPFLDRSVAELAGRIPARLKLKGFKKRYLFKRAFRDLLPAEIIRKKKHGFGIPVATWINSDPKLREFSADTLLSRRAFERGYFRREFVEELFRKHAADDTTFYGDTIWTFLAMELWHRQVVDEPARATV